MTLLLFEKRILCVSVYVCVCVRMYVYTHFFYSLNFLQCVYITLLIRD